MRALVVGGAGSGKSAFAEGLACTLAPPRTYVATMAGDGAEATQRIRRHQEQRAGLGFHTIECMGSLEQAYEAEHRTEGVALVDDVGNLVANALFDATGTMHDAQEAFDRLTREFRALTHTYAHVVVVGNEVGSAGPYPHRGTQTWIRLTGSLCCALAAAFDVVVEVTAGIPHVIKGDLA